jgi:ribokinase
MIIVFGSINIDITVYGQRLPLPGETVQGDRSAIALDGKGCNQAVAVARLGGDVQLVERRGIDAFGTLACDELAAYGVSDTYVVRDPINPTGIAVIGVDAAGENSISIVGGANGGITVGDMDDQRAVFVGADLMLVQLEIMVSAILHAANIVRASGGRVILDPAPAPGPGVDVDALLAVADIVTPNEAETDALVGIRPTTPEQAERAALAFHDKGVARPENS